MQKSLDFGTESIMKPIYGSKSSVTDQARKGSSL